ncbi:MAG: 50S ribosomal protein L6 [Zetaproteobacteria bacterium CG_4_9_14_3_um_filter_49_83]|nr:MAG: 50S ribosomal protein L6 [Zetaproteobacteria bacterium CG1_02_49_23]PIQ32700.1 MAG: 50S ribosomal protein L6 [Zetaproteobacteria bacterium CG17_big_fil_post_rev_8_21_14_2_50_50_13]PIY55305.1 MAG: 50S ribosomal protein L6 [Zetaproteobacteria bacterium CG_4_10_14_0_8_um_filter_49_80]PJA36117.1 MAG: 50S ribosomal protein L6 [Zetaproteobacteria bacterium CG_4_9_14_3_um_filter_49_83]
MSRVGKQPISIPAGVEVKIQPDHVFVKGPKGEMTSALFKGVTVQQEENTLVLECSNLDDKKTKSFFGLARALLAANIEGVSKGFEKVLELRGVGYRAQAQGSKLNLALGFSHPIEYDMPEGVDVRVEQSKIIISGYDKQKVGQVAAEVRAFRPPEPYKGKGVRYVDEYVAMKEGKKA